MYHHHSNSQIFFFIIEFLNIVIFSEFRLLEQDEQMLNSYNDQEKPQQQKQVINYFTFLEFKIMYSPFCQINDGNILSLGER